MTYYAVLSIFPALAAMIALVGLVANPQTITTELTKLVSSIGRHPRRRRSRSPSRAWLTAAAQPESC